MSSILLTNKGAGHPAMIRSGQTPPYGRYSSCDECSSKLSQAPDQELGKRVAKANEYLGRCLAVFTSGGDSQGMNATVRAVVRFARYLGCRVFFIKEGYQGMVDGGDYIVEAHWTSVSGIIHKGGTIIGSARCTEFREKEGRLKAAKNLVDKGINNLVVIGGDGSLTGANLFRQEWPELLDVLLERQLISEEQRKQNANLNIVGIVGSIDNDFCGTDMTIGTDSALHRIIEAVDCIVPTASSHQRTFILEVMGRHCGYLALVAAIVSEADFVFIPEWPPEVNWRSKMCTKLSQAREMGQRLNIIIIAEGAIDLEGQAITAEQVRKVVVDDLGQDTRITVLGHVQRGGNPSAFDRILGCRMGAEAVLTLMEAKPQSEAFVITLDGNTAVKLPLMECVKRTQDVAMAMESKNWAKAVDLRGYSFRSNLDMYRMLTRVKPKPCDFPDSAPRFRMAVMHVGAPCCGMNAAVRSFVRSCIINGHVPFGVHNGVEGLVANDIEEMTWTSVDGWTPIGGALLGTKRTVPVDKLDQVASCLRSNELNGLLIIGGFEAFQTALHLAEHRQDYPEFCIPIVVVPATISNNVPGSDLSLGSDTSLNEITEICDRIRQSAQGTKRRAFVVEVMGGYCGYLATMAGLASGCDAAYIHEEKFGVHDLIHDLNVLKSKMERGKIERGLFLRNEKADDIYTTDFLSQLLSHEGKNIFSVRTNVLGHMQQGGSPTPFDRNFGTKMAAKAFEWLAATASKHFVSGKVYTSDKSTVVLLGITRRQTHFQSIEDLKKETDFQHRRAKSQWWMQIRSIMKILARHDSTYMAESQEVEGTQSNF